MYSVCIACTRYSIPHEKDIITRRSLYINSVRSKSGCYWKWKCRTKCFASCESSVCFFAVVLQWFRWRLPICSFQQNSHSSIRLIWLSAVAATGSEFTYQFSVLEQASYFNMFHFHLDVILECDKNRITSLIESFLFFLCSAELTFGAGKSRKKMKISKNLSRNSYFFYLYGKFFVITAIQAEEINKFAPCILIWKQNCTNRDIYGVFPSTYLFYIQWQ